MGTITVPIGSMCLMGLRVKRPAAFAVGSPNCKAVQPWATSWTVIANITGTAATITVTTMLGISIPSMGIVYAVPVSCDQNPALSTQPNKIVLAFKKLYYATSQFPNQGRNA